MFTSRSLFSRRSLLKGLGLVAAGGAAATHWFKRVKSSGTAIQGKMIDSSSAVGHLLREGFAEAPTQKKEIGTLIVGSGIAGLSAGWWLQKQGYSDYIILELDSIIGGNSKSGMNQVSEYPWGAHYVPIPGAQATYVKEFFKEIGVITDFKNGLPEYNEFYLCADYEERLLFRGEWREGLIPQYGLSEEEQTQFRQFFSYIEGLRWSNGSDGKPAFTIPIDESSQDPKFLSLDKVSMADFMKSNHWDSPKLNWYINYCCRDDYGQGIDRVSAWAGLHYFASRNGKASNADSQAVLTWPEGNGFLVKKLANFSANKIRTHHLVYKIRNSKSGVEVDVLNSLTKQTTRFLAHQVIFSGPRYTANRIVEGLNVQANKSLSYAPWVVANVTLRSIPSSNGAPLAWDNVSYNNKSLGYIVATHQDVRVLRKGTVITYYRSLDEESPNFERNKAYRRTRVEWEQLVLSDLEQMHPDILKHVVSMDIKIWGHGMISPGIDFLWSHERKKMQESFGGVHFAHSDMSGISIFEEAQYRGILAAKKVLSRRIG